ncbi:MAG TPA: DUF5941 domain-containing protein [Solirubrobacteraceae bacterium]|nr:DUF5941 domain-containing protein [Solirubrobacteraceae bacterium]
MTSALAVYRDDGPLAAALGGIGRRVALPGAVFAVLAALLVVVPALVAGADVEEGAAGAAVAAAAILGGLARGRAESGSFRWLVPPAIRLTEYAGILWLGAVAGGSGPPAAFVLVAALTFRHYDLVYRLRHRGVTPPRWVDLAGLGWEGRLLLGVLLLALGVLAEGFFVLAAIFAVVFVAESVAGWTGTVRTQQTAVYEEEEDEGQ